MNAIDMLMDEHRLIEQVLNSLEKFTDKLENGEPVDRQEFVRFSEFFREFADRCHHGKEEDILFDEMTKNGFSKETGPVAVMLNEHDLGRERVKMMREAGETKDWSGGLREKSVLASREFVVLLSNHILKEDRILFPLAADQLPRQIVDGLLNKFNDFNANKLGNENRKKLTDLGHELASKYS